MEGTGNYQSPFEVPFNLLALHCEALEPAGSTPKPGCGKFPLGKDGGMEGRNEDSGRVLVGDVSRTCGCSSILASHSFGRVEHYPTALSHWDLNKII